MFIKVVEFFKTHFTPCPIIDKVFLYRILWFRLVNDNYNCLLIIKFIIWGNYGSHFLDKYHLVPAFRPDIDR